MWPGQARPRPHRVRVLKPDWTPVQAILSRSSFRLRHRINRHVFCDVNDTQIPRRRRSRKPGREDTMIFPRFAAALASCLVLVLPARGEDMLRIAMTASDIPTTTGMPNNGFEGMRFLGYPIFEGPLPRHLSPAHP